MIAVETVIRKLIGEYEFVIIPGFGALLSHQVPAIYDNNSGFFTPPAKRLAFNEYLKLDDGLLANYISRHEEITHSDAVDYVKVYTDRLRSGLEFNGRALIAGIGEFNKNVEGKLVFEPKTEKYFKDEWYGFQKVKVKQLEKKAVIAALENNYVNDDAVEVLELEEETRKPFKWTNWAAAAAIAGLLCGLSLFLVNSNGGDIQSTLNPFTELFSSFKTEKEEPKKEPEAVVVIPESKIEIQPVLKDSVAGEAVAEVKDSAGSHVPEVLPTVNVPVVTGPAPAMAKFYVIAGAFKGSKQAKILLAELKTKGFTEASILPGDKFSTKVKVAINGFETETDAYRASAKLKAVIGEAGWVFKRR
ncbi:MAG: SPOR domain-containing protein [Dyadobacter sp.]|uniref:HU domain-containing protein n=1 Tax=Dyadobacter sp. TaxID=1914288 RepID=UPI0032657631